MISLEVFKRIRAGDTVELRFVGEVISASRRFIDVTTDEGTFTVEQHDIVSHTPAPRDIEVGHIVLRNDCPIEFTVRAIADGEAWIHSPTVFDRIVKISDLTFLREA